MHWTLNRSVATLQPKRKTVFPHAVPVIRMIKLPQITLALACALFTSTGCKLLSVDLDRTYQDVSTDASSDSVDRTPDIPVDITQMGDETPDVPPGEVKLRITELMINSTQMNSSDPEDGEFIEVYNAGSQAVDLKDVRLQFKTDGDFAYAIEAREPIGQVPEAYTREWERLGTLEPGEYFVFIHGNNPVFEFDSIPGQRFYSWHWPAEQTSKNKSLVNGSNDAVRRLELVYVQTAMVEHAVTWRDGKFYASDPEGDRAEAIDIEENISITLDQGSIEEVDLVGSWCLSTTQWASASAHGDKPFLATPGSASQCPPPAE